MFKWFKKMIDNHNAKIEEEKRQLEEKRQKEIERAVIANEARKTIEDSRRLLEKIEYEEREKEKRRLEEERRKQRSRQERNAYMHNKSTVSASNIRGVSLHHTFMSEKDNNSSSEKNYHVGESSLECNSSSSSSSYDSSSSSSSSSSDSGSSYSSGGSCGWD